MNENKDDLTLSKQIYEETFLRNPVLISVIGLCPVVAISTTLKSALILSGITFLIMLIAEFFASTIFKHISQWIRIGLYTITGMLIVSPIMFLLNRFSPDVMLALGIYLPLMAVNPLIVRQCERDAIDASVKQVLKNSISVSVAYSLVLIIVGFLRELLGSGAIWGHKIISSPAAVSLTMPFGGFLIIGFMAALLRFYIKKKDPEYEEELAFNSRISLQKKKPQKEQKKDILNDELDVIPFLAKKIIEEVQIKEKEVSVPEPQPLMAQEQVGENIQEETQGIQDFENSDEISIDESQAKTKDNEKENVEETVEDIVQTADEEFDLNIEAEINLLKNSHIEDEKEPELIKDSQNEDKKEKFDLNQDPQPEVLPVKDMIYDPENIINEMINEIKTDKKSNKKPKPQKPEHEEKVVFEKPITVNKKENKIEYTSSELEDIMSKSLDELVTGIKEDKKNKDNSDKEVPRK